MLRAQLFRRTGPSTRRGAAGTDWFFLGAAARITDKKNDDSSN
jgi:hypothetical protein